MSFTIGSKQKKETENMAEQTVTAGTAGTRRLIANSGHTVLVLALVALNAYRGVMFAARVRAGLVPDRAAMYLRTMLIELVMVGIVAYGVWRREKSLEAIFGERWRRVGQVLSDLGLGFGLWLMALIVVSILGSLGGHGGNSNQAVGYLLPRSGREYFLWICLSVTAGICEEAIFRGYLQRQFSALTRSVPLGIVLSSAAFGAVHGYQGLPRALVIGASATLFGMMAEWRGSVRPGMIAHAFQDGIAPVLLKMMRH
jgi:membrane protease YdiL (CAAX protease family)